MSSAACANAAPLAPPRTLARRRPAPPCCVRMTSRLHLCRPERDPPLLAELAATFPAPSTHALAASGLVWSELSPADAARAPCLAFAEQVLPAPRAVAARSVTQWSDALADAVLEGLRDHDGPWRLHVLSAAPAPGSRLGPGRARLIREQALDRIKERRRALRRALVEDDRPFAADEALVQLVLVSLESGWLSLCEPDELRRLRRCLSRFPAGVVAVPEDRAPPSRAYAKLLEAELHAGLVIGKGDTVVDLGGSPGGWSAVALQRGARVLAVDRAPLRDDLMRHARLAFRRGDAFAFRPDAAPRGAEPLPEWLAPPVDWLLCDVIAFPERTLDLLRQWLTARWCRRFVVTVKFRGPADLGRLAELKALLEASGAEFLVRRLRANKNEVTAAGELVESRRAPSV
jgi:23S rRNA (cytidine2498-2'-O)-methyltransferase